MEPPYTFPSVRKIPFKYLPNLRKYFSHVPVVEIYRVTEGVFAQQIDDLHQIILSISLR